jgi:lauroyl/myristoyl acyltransferase
MGMEKQLQLFVKENHGSVIWFKLPEPCRKEIVNLLAELIIRFLTSSNREAVNDEK